MALINTLMADRLQGRRMTLAGDRNAIPLSEEIKQLTETWLTSETDSTFPAEKPTKRIDYILATPATGWRVVSAKILEATDESDHRPVLTTLELLP